MFLLVPARSVYFRKSVTLGFLNAKFQFGDCQCVCYSRKYVISEAGTSENLCNYEKYQCKCSSFLQELHFSANYLH